MTDIIRLLPDSVANQIAAGEVIQRPASVVKELVENSVDAGATRIDIIIQDAGRTLIQIIDNGCGMSETDARLAFERHATSKIAQAADIYTLSTMGFRGEALPSIAAVAQIDVRTMTEGATMGTRLLINGSHVESQEPVATARGTNLMVKNIFYNIPVRRKFLKKDSVEMSNILREFERLALVNPSLEFSIAHNGTTLHHLLPATFKSRIIDLFGKSLDRQLIPISTSTSLVTIDGYIVMPEFARRRGALQYFFVNGRNMRHPYFHKAVVNCYQSLIPADAQPVYFINFTVDPSTIDVNIHPTKNEIKFENEQPIWQILSAAIRESLSRFNAFPAIDFNREDAPDIPAFEPTALSGAPTLAIDSTFNPFDTASGATGTPGTAGGSQRRASSSSHVTPRPVPDAADWQKLYEGFHGGGTSQPELTTHPSLLNTPAGEESSATAAESGGGGMPEFDSAGTLALFSRYIVAPTRSGMMLIDRRRAHIAVLYHRYRRQADGTRLASQQILFPETVELTPSQSSILETIGDEVEQLGYRLERTEGTDIWHITAIPDALADANPADILLKILDTEMEMGDDPSAAVYDRIALSMARAVAINADTPLTPAEREQLVASLLSLPDPSYTPDGLTILTALTYDDLNRLF